MENQNLDLSTPSQQISTSPAHSFRSRFFTPIIGSILLLELGFIGGYAVRDMNNQPINETSSQILKVSSTPIQPPPTITMEASPPIAQPSISTRTNQVNNMRMTISPQSGPVGTIVHVKITGLPKILLIAPGIHFIDKEEGFGSLDLESTSRNDDLQPDAKGSLELYVKIPSNVLRWDPIKGGQPSIEDKTSLGKGIISYYHSSWPGSGDGKWPHADAEFVVTAK